MASEIRGSDNFDSSKAGKVVQMVNYQTSTVISTTSIIPWDNTIPQITEGAEFLSLSITPQSASNILIIEGVLSVTADIVNQISAKSLFIAGTSNALYTTNTYISSNNQMLAVPMRYKMVAGATTPLTFSIRAGNHTANRVTMNGWQGAVYYGGSWTSSIQITEFAP
tara:strand:+ start:52 stop:552 length:501 start_codon:yes stop_codon:yes gene_type:complete